MEEVRLQKIIADRGYCSRRHAEELISAGKVKVNGECIISMGNKFPADVKIEVEGQVLAVPAKSDFVYLLMNKPIGVLTTMKDDRGRRCISELIPEKYGRLFPVGRLDIDTSGLIILTDDGEFANLVMHPSGELPKTYRAVVEGKITSLEIKQLEHGVVLEDGLTAPAKVEVESVNLDESVIRLTIHEGKNREIRRMLEAVDHPIHELERVKIGHLNVNLPRGKFVELSSADIKRMKDFCRENRRKAGYKTENKKI